MSAPHPESAITQEEYAKAIRGAATKGGIMISDADDIVQAFFAALPADVKLTRPVATAEMYATALQKTGNPDGARLWMIMHQEAPTSLPEPKS